MELIPGCLSNLLFSGGHVVDSDCNHVTFC